ncbi:exported hypothetical protein [Desulfamplus magnetovallimortis]|uniref:Tetratricopeptide repeat protein n=1 Tax=Desulfamplus magnetovallimortis TaxID=1246637 RepID=A0A1W1HL07_9BACT|nr:hypothetical protein [Desulfamplus magnetovallimortis]SLM33159.1 exported hypothetical protein [Desulfamplus magnetovallimortis]
MQIKIKNYHLANIIFAFFLSLSTATYLQTHWNSNNKGIYGSCSICEANSLDIARIPLPPDLSFFNTIFPANKDFIADLLWLKTAYLYGNITKQGAGYEYLTFYLDTITSLASKWKFPYIFAAVIITFEGNLKEDGYYFIEKGIKNLPDEWKLWLYKGYYIWKVKNDYKQASQIFAEASKKKGAPKYFAAVSTTLAMKSGDDDFAKRLALDVINTLDDQTIVNRILKKINNKKDENSEQ